MTEKELETIVARHEMQQLELKESFAALHKECRCQTGQRTARDCGRVGDFD